MLALESVSYTYGASVVIDSVSFTLHPGKLTVMLGPNGSGKSTIALILAGLLSPSTGQVDLYLDERPSPVPVGIVFQDPDDQLVASTVSDDVSFGPANLGLSAEVIAQRVRDALSRVGLSGYERREVHTLSGGERQRVALAGVLALEPVYLILDEADAMLDAINRQAISRIIQEEREAGKGILMITHDSTNILDADEVVVLDKGRVEAICRPGEVLAELETLHSTGIHVPRYLMRMAELAQRNPGFSPTVDPLISAQRALSCGIDEVNVL